MTFTLRWFAFWCPKEPISALGEDGIIKKPFFFFFFVPTGASAQSVQLWNELLLVCTVRITYSIRVSCLSFI